MGKIYEQVYRDTIFQVVDVELYQDKTAVISVDMLNDRIIPWYT